ncbi:MAG: hypothetical protein U0736_08875 [Gemmataceae bacterium]
MTPNTTVRQPSRSTQLSVLYITIGVLLTIWSSVWYYFLRHAEYSTDNWRYYVCIGSLFSGIALLIIGLLLGRIGREAQRADVPIGYLPPATTPVVPAAPAAPVATAAPAPPASTPATGS